MMVQLITKHLKNMVESQIAAGTDGIVVAGTTGEASTIDDAEQIKLIKYLC